jgi:predicted secreted protein
MNIASAIAIYFVIWWLVLFIALPFGVRNSHESGAVVEEGHEAGAPVNPKLLQKAVVTTVIATIVFVVFYYAKTRGFLTLENLPFFDSMPKPNG